MKPRIKSFISLGKIFFEYTGRLITRPENVGFLYGNARNFIASKLGVEPRYTDKYGKLETNVAPPKEVESRKTDENYQNCLQRLGEALDDVDVIRVQEELGELQYHL